MRFDTAERVEEVVWNMRLAEQPRAENRATLNRMYNGQPPFDESTAEENGVQVNRNFLEGVNLLAQGRRQWNNAFLKPGNYFNVSLDGGPPHKRREWSKIITRHLNRCLKRSPDYMESKRATGANVILHGIAPVNWESRSTPIPCPLGVDDVLVPSETYVSFRNLDHFAIYRQYSPATLYQLTHGPKRDPGWQMEMVESELKAKADEYQQVSSQHWLQPEKLEESFKENIGFWGTDCVPTIDVWDFYFRESDDGNGWYRRMVLDSGMGAEAGRVNSRPDLKNQWLYTSGKRKYAQSLRNILHCNFGDTSAVAPFRYHSVRSLGYMLWGVCELQNRLRCKFTESVFEQLMWFFRSGNEGQFNKIKKAMFSHMGVIPEGISFVTATERFKPDHNLVNLLLSQNRQLMGENAASFTQDFRQGGEQEMTATETMARVNAVNALVSGMLNLAYVYETYEYQETCRRFCLNNSQHIEVKKFRLNCLKDGVPEEMLDSDRWDIDPERVLGAGNKTLEIAQAQQLLELRPFLGGQAQQEVVHVAIEAFTDDPAMAERFAPIEGHEKLSQAKEAAMLAVGTIMQGGIVEFGEEHNRRDLIETLLLEMALIVQRIVSTGSMATAQEVAGLQNMGMHIAQLLQLIEQDKGEQERAKQYADQLGNLMNSVTGFAQRLEEQQQASAGAEGNGEMAKTAAKIQSDRIMAEAKAANTRESHAQRTAQRQVQFESQQKQKEDEHQLEMRRQLESQEVEDVTQGIKTAAEIQRENAKAKNETAKTE